MSDESHKIHPMTKGVHHIGLTVAKLEQSVEFFVKVLGWSIVRRDENYPAAFVSDGTTMITLWAAKTDNPTPFSRKENIGLHHLALLVEDFAALESIHQRLKQHDIAIEFEPELLREGPAKHMMCYEPGGIRIEFICVPKLG